MSILSLALDAKLFLIYFFFHLLKTVPVAQYLSTRLYSLPGLALLPHFGSKGDFLLP